MLHPEVESYLVIMSLIKNKTKVVTDTRGNEHVASNIDSIMLHRKYVIISNTWFLLHVNPRFKKQIIRLLKKSGINEDDISVVDSGFYDKIYVTQDPNLFIPCLIKFEELIAAKNNV